MSDNPRPRWQIYIGYGDDGQVRYYFQDTDPPYRDICKPGVIYGTVLLFVGRNFYYKLKAHDAIEYCRDLNAKDYNLPNDPNATALGVRRG
jgi:hypothetical protein